MDLLRNPFHILSASPRDNRKRIIELADERGLLLESNECAKASSDLTNPRRRLSAEVAWLPDTKPIQTEKILSLLVSSPEELLGFDEFIPIARANLLAAGITRLPSYNADDVEKWIYEIAYTFEAIIPRDVQHAINEERVVSGFPEVSDISAIESEIQEQRQHYRNAIKYALDGLSSEDIIKTVTKIVDKVTRFGEEQGPVLIADIVDFYEIEAQTFFDKEEDNIRFLIGKIRSLADANHSDDTLVSILNMLVKTVKNWDIVAQPIQVSTKSRGINHNASQRMAETIRELALYLFNEHKKIEFAKRITELLQEVFAEVVEVAELAIEDANSLTEIAKIEQSNRLLEPILNLCASTIKNIKIRPHSAEGEIAKMIGISPRLISELFALKPNAAILSEGKNAIALTIMQCAITYGNTTKKWKTCIVFLKSAFEYADNQNIKSAIQKNISQATANKSYGGFW